MTTAKNDALKLVVLCRVSTNGQIDGYGLDAQEKDARRWAKRNGHQIVKVCRDEGITGKAGDDERPGLHEALQMVANGDVDGVLAPNLDRIARELTQQEAILSVIWAHNSRVFTADRGEHLPDDDDDPMRTFVRQVMGAAAQLERGLIVKRLKGGRRAKASAGGYAYGAPAYGEQAVEHEIVEHPAEADVLCQMREWEAEGLGVREIARRLNHAGIKSKRGGTWHPTAVARLLNPDARASARAQSASARAAKRREDRKNRANKVLGRLG